MQRLLAYTKVQLWFFSFVGKKKKSPLWLLTFSRNKLPLEPLSLGNVGELCALAAGVAGKSREGCLWSLLTEGRVQLVQPRKQDQVREGFLEEPPMHTHGTEGNGLINRWRLSPASSERKGSLGCEFAAPQMCYCFCVFPSWSLFQQRKMSDSAKYTIAWQWVSHTGSQQPARQIPLLSLERPSSAAPGEAGLSLHRELHRGWRWQKPLLASRPHLGSCTWREPASSASQPMAPWAWVGQGLPRASSPQLSGTSCCCMKYKNQR